MDDLASDTDNYLNLILSFPELSPTTVLGLIMLTLFRLVSIIAFAPFLGAINLPAMGKMLFGFALTAIFLPGVLMSATPDLEFDWLFVGYSLKELLIGYILGILIAVPFYIAQTAGSLIDHIRGASSLQVTDPTTQSSTGPIGIFYNYVLIAVFFLIDGPFFFFNAVADSFQLIPVDKFFNTAFFSINVPFWRLIIGLFTHIMGLAIQLGAPSIVGILMTEMFLGIANRLAPQVQIVFLGIPLKSWVGIALLAVAWYFIVEQLGKESLGWVKVINNMVYKLKPLVQT